MDKELERLEEHIRLLDDSLWYINWGIRFSITAMVTEAIGVVEIFRGNLTGALELLGTSIVLLGINVYLHDKSRECFRRGHGDE